jgi:curved DNA-binding protein CbpA
MNTTDPRHTADPWQVLGIGQGADDEQIRRAYLEKVKEYPPDRCSDQFQQVRQAYDQLKDPYRRARHLILGSSPDQPLESLLGEAAPARRFVGPGPWLAALKDAGKAR